MSLFKPSSIRCISSKIKSLVRRKPVNFEGSINSMWWNMSPSCTGLKEKCIIMKFHSLITANKINVHANMLYMYNLILSFNVPFYVLNFIKGCTKHIQCWPEECKPFMFYFFGFVSSIHDWTCIDQHVHCTCTITSLS